MFVITQLEWYCPLSTLLQASKLASSFSFGFNSLSLKSETNVGYKFSILEALWLLSNNLTNFSKFSGKFPYLVYLDLSNNNLSGKLPKWIRDMDSLYYLNLSHNQLTSIDQFSWFNLKFLDLSSNLMSDEISSFFCNASSLEVVNLSRNKFTGTIPPCLSNLSYLKVLDLHMNKLYGTLPSTFSLNKWIDTLWEPICNTLFKIKCW